MTDKQRPAWADPMPWDEAPLGIYGVAIWNREAPSNPIEWAACRITTGIPFLGAVLPCRDRMELPTITATRLPDQWRRFWPANDLPNWQIMTGDKLIDIDPHPPDIR